MLAGCIFTSDKPTCKRTWQSGWWFQPLRKIWQSVGIIIPNIWEIKKCLKPPTRHDNYILRKTWQWKIHHQKRCHIQMPSPGEFPGTFYGPEMISPYKSPLKEQVNILINKETWWSKPFKTLLFTSKSPANSKHMGFLCRSPMCHAQKEMVWSSHHQELGIPEKMAHQIPMTIPKSGHVYIDIYMSKKHLWTMYVCTSIISIFPAWP